MESLGGFGQQAVGFINHLATMLADRKGVDVSQFALEIRRKLNFISVQATATAIASRLPLDDYT